MSEFTIRQTEPKDFGAIVNLQLVCFPLPFPQEDLWNSDDLAAHLAAFPEGQIVAEIEGAVVGSATSLIVSEEHWDARLGWWSMAGGTKIENHDPEGTTLYGLDVSVGPGARGRGIGRALYEARFVLATRLSLARFGTACRIPDLVQHPDLSPEDYASAVVEGKFSDRTLTPFLKIGMTYLEIIQDYMPDEESRNCAALLEKRV